MTERPILFSGPMVRAILEGRKSQTRRVVKAQPPACKGFPRLLPSGEWGLYLDRPAGGPYQHIGRCPYGQPGDRLWVRETFAVLDEGGGMKATHYRADAGGDARIDRVAGERWRPAIHMPRAACRLVLEIAAVRVERLQDISAEDAKAEGITLSPAELYPEVNTGYKLKRDYKFLWDSLNARRAPWSSNPWVWVVEFRRCLSTTKDKPC